VTITVHHLVVRLEIGADGVTMAVHVTTPPHLTDGENVKVVTTPHIAMRPEIILIPILAIMTIIAEVVTITSIPIATISNLVNLMWCRAGVKIVLTEVGEPNLVPHRSCEAPSAIFGPSPPHPEC